MKDQFLACIEEINFYFTEKTEIGCSKSEGLQTRFFGGETGRVPYGWIPGSRATNDLLCGEDAVVDGPTLSCEFLLESFRVQQVNPDANDHAAPPLVIYSILYLTWKMPL